VSTTERLKASLLIPLDDSWVFKAGVDQTRGVRKNGTTLPGVVTDGEHVIERLAFGQFPLGCDKTAEKELTFSAVCIFDFFYAVIPSSLKQVCYVF